jgi:hypothetical protein
MDVEIEKTLLYFLKNGLHCDMCITPTQWLLGV